MKNLRTFAVMFFIISLATAYANNADFKDEIKIKLYGSGGIIVLSDGTQKVCPVQGTMTCAEITVNTNSVKNGSLYNANGVLEFQGTNQNITIISCTNIIDCPQNCSTNGGNMIYKNQ